MRWIRREKGFGSPNVTEWRWENTPAWFSRFVCRCRGIDVHASCCFVGVGRVEKDAPNWPLVCPARDMPEKKVALYPWSSYTTYIETHCTVFSRWSCPWRNLTKILR